MSERATLPYRKRMRIKKPVDSDAARLIDGICRRRQWTYHRLANEIGCDHTMISRMRDGTRTPSRHLLAQFAARVRLNADEKERLFVVFGLIPPGYRVVPGAADDLPEIARPEDI